MKFGSLNNISEVFFLAFQFFKLPCSLGAREFGFDTEDTVEIYWGRDIVLGKFIIFF